MRTSVLGLNAASVLTLERSLNRYHDYLASELQDWCYTLNTQPSATAQILSDSPEHQELLQEVKQVNLLKRQIAYQKQVLGVKEE